MPRSGQYGDVAARYRTADGWSVEVVRLSGTPDKHDGEWIRVRQFGWFVADVRSIACLERYVALAELQDALTTARCKTGFAVILSLDMAVGVRAPAG